MKRLSKQKVVFDTNLVVSALIRGGTPYKVLQAWTLNAFYLLITQNLFAEIVKVFDRDKIKKKYDVEQAEIDWLIESLRLNGKFILPIKLKDIPIHSRDVKDDMVLACALGGNSDYLVTGDRDLLVLNGNPKIGNLKIVSPKEFLKLLP